MSEAQENLDDVFEEGTNLNEDGKDENELRDGMAETDVPKGYVYKPLAEDEWHGLPRGYMSKEDWVASGKDIADWVSPEGFKLRGEHIKHTQALKREFDNQIKNLSLFHQIQLKNQREELLSKRDDAIDIADKAAVKSFDKQLKELDDMEKLQTPEVPASNAKAPEILEWEQENEWSQDPNDPRLKIANRVFQEAVNQGKTFATALRMVDKQIAEKFSSKPATPRQIAEGSRTAGGKRDDVGTLSMKTLTREEQQAWDSGLYDNEKDFLKTVANYRKEAKK